MAIDRNNDLVSAQEKMEWVTPKILLMSAGDTTGSNKPFAKLEGPIPTAANEFFSSKGPS